VLIQIKKIIDQKEPVASIITVDHGSVAIMGNIQDSTITTSYHSYEKKPE
jgi:hypothetical protein